MPILKSTSVAFLSFALLCSAAVQPASAAMIGVVAPKTGPYAALGEQVFQGARAAAQAAGDTLVEVDEPCEEAGGDRVAKALADGRAQVAVGFLCVETLTTSLPVLARDNIPTLTISVRSKILMEDALRNNWPFFRMAPSESAEADALAQAIGRLWKAEPVAFVDDGTIYGRELVAAVRQKLEPLGISPVFTDTLRPGQEQQIALVRRLQKAGASHLLLGADRHDAAVIARDAAAENIPMTLLGGDALRAADRPVPLRNGVLAVALPTYEIAPVAAETVIALRAKTIEPEGHVLPAYAAVQVAGQAVDAADAGETSVPAALAEARFNTVIGEIGFTKEHELADNPYRLLEWRSPDFVLPPSPTE
jgi:branched-chain amino acid transport system substrate-binding protein